MLDTFDTDLLRKAFEVVDNAKGCGDLGCVEINGYSFHPGEPEDEELLKLLAMSPARDDMVKLRDMLNRAIAQPTEDDEGAEEELEAAAKVFEGYLKSGYLLDLSWDGKEVVWQRWMPAFEGNPALEALRYRA